MCRMLAVEAPTNVEAASVLGAFRAQSRAAATGPKGKERHADGWGMVAAARGRLTLLARRPTDAAADPEYEATLRRVEGVPGPSRFLAHFRQASRGVKSVANTHPFLAEGWAFCHNGTIHGTLEDSGTVYEGTTDSERYFHRLLRHLSQGKRAEVAMRECVQELDSLARYSSLTCLFTDGERLFGYRRLGTEIGDCGTKECQAEYYALGFGTLGRATVVAQERTHLGPIRNWKTVPDDGFLEWRPGSSPRITRLDALREPVAPAR